jgi:hypothetical protein
VPPSCYGLTRRAQGSLALPIGPSRRREAGVVIDVALRSMFTSASAKNYKHAARKFSHLSASSTLRFHGGRESRRPDEAFSLWTRSQVRTGKTDAVDHPETALESERYFGIRISCLGS